MARFAFFLMLTVIAWGGEADRYRLALLEHKGLMSWSVAGYTVVENSAKPSGEELGVRGSDKSSGRSFLGFLFLVPESAPASSASCRDAAMAQEKKAALQDLKLTEIERKAALSVALARYATENRNKSVSYVYRGFIASGDLCGDLEFYGDRPISGDDATVKMAFQTLELDLNYVPQFADVSMYSEVLFRTRQYKAAAPALVKALGMVPDNGAPFPSAVVARRVVRDQAGMAYGVSGDLGEARRIFVEGVVTDPDYPLNYYNLACADAGEHKLADARLHLKQAFDRKANVLPGERMPDPTQDDSFLPYKSDKDFWSYLEMLHGN